jgi:hypothetical protein
MRVSGEADQAQALKWVVRCDGGADIASIPLGGSAPGASFAVPTGCRAQWLELVGTASDIPQQSDVTIRQLRLSRGGTGA